MYVKLSNYNCSFDEEYYKEFFKGHDCPSNCCPNNNSAKSINPINSPPLGCGVQLCFGIDSKYFIGSLSKIPGFGCYFSGLPSGEYDDTLCPKSPSGFQRIKVQQIQTYTANCMIGQSKNSMFVDPSNIGKNVFYCQIYSELKGENNQNPQVNISINFNGDSTTHMGASQLFIVIDHRNNQETGSKYSDNIIVNVNCQANVACYNTPGSFGPRQHCNENICKNAQKKINNVVVPYGKAIIITNFVKNSSTNSQYFVNYCLTQFTTNGAPTDVPCPISSCNFQST